MNIFFVLGGLRVGGYEILTVEIANDLSAKGYNVSIVSLSSDKDILHRVNEAIQVYFTPRKNNFDFTAVIKFRKILKNSKPDIVFSCAYYAHFFSKLASGFLSHKLKFVLAFHATRPTSSKNHIENKVFSFFDTFIKDDIYIAIHKSQIEFYNRKYNIKKDKFVVIYNGIDTNYFSNPNQPAFNQNRVIKLVHVASLKPLKDQWTLLKAMVELNKHLKNWTLEIAGADVAGLQNDYKNYVRKKGLTEKIKFLGPIKNVKSLLQKADIFLLTSKTEALPVSIIEAMSIKLAVITTNVGGCPELVSDGVEGFLVDVEDYKAIANKVLYLYQHPDVLAKMAGKSRIKVEEQFSFEKMMNKYVTLLEKTNCEK